MSTDASADDAPSTTRQKWDGTTRLQKNRAGLSQSQLLKQTQQSLTMLEMAQLMEALDRENSSRYRPGMIDSDQAVHDTAMRFCKMNVMDPCKDAPCEQHSALAGIAVQAVFDQLPAGVVMGGDWRTAERLWNGRKLYKIDQRARARSYDSSAKEEELSERSAPEADLISSRVLGLEDEWHMPAIDIDMPVYAVRSDTPDHSHLYIQKKMHWDAYLKLLQAMAEAGIVEEGYVQMSEVRGASFLYMPGRGRGSRARSRDRY